MERSWLFVGAVAVFAARDAWIVGARPPRLGYAFAAVTLLAGLAAGGLGAALSAAEVEAWLAHPAFWAGGLALHAALAFRSLRRAGKAAAGGLAEMLPSPVFAVGLVLLARAVLERTNALGGLEAGCAVAAGYLLLTAALSAGFGKIRRDGAVSRLAAWSHLTAVLLVPLSAAANGAGTVQGKGAAPAWGSGADWAAALGVASVTALSFCWRRYRSGDTRRRPLSARSRSR